MGWIHSWVGLGWFALGRNFGKYFGLGWVRLDRLNHVNFISVIVVAIVTVIVRLDCFVTVCRRHTSYYNRYTYDLGQFRVFEFATFI